MSSASRLSSLAVAGSLVLGASTVLAQSTHGRRHRHPVPVQTPDPATAAQGPASPTATPAASQQPVPEPAPAPAVAPTPVVTAPPAEEPPATVPALDIAVGFRAFNRRLSWDAATLGAFHNYSLDIASAVSASVEWYPGAHFSTGAAAWIGLVAMVDHDLGLVSVDARQQQYPTSAWGVLVGVRARYPFGRSDLGLTVAYGVQSYTVTAAPAPPDPGEPAVGYQYLRLALGGRVGVGSRVAILADLGFMPVLSGGDLTTTYFPHASVLGFSATVGAAVHVVAGLEVRVLLDARWFLTTTNAAQGDTWTTASASDRYLTGTFAVAWRR